MTKHNYIGQFIRTTRERRGLSQGDLARALGLRSAQSISNIERGVSPFPVKHTKVFAESLGLTQRRLLSAVIRHEGRRIAREAGVRSL